MQMNLAICKLRGGGRRRFNPSVEALSGSGATHDADSDSGFCRGCGNSKRACKGRQQIACGPARRSGGAIRQQAQRVKGFLTPAAAQGSNKGQHSGAVASVLAASFRLEGGFRGGAQVGGRLGVDQGKVSTQRHGAARAAGLDVEDCIMPASSGVIPSPGGDADLLIGLQAVGGQGSG